MASLVVGRIKNAATTNVEAGAKFEAYVRLMRYDTICENLSSAQELT